MVINFSHCVLVDDEYLSHDKNNEKLFGNNGLMPILGMNTKNVGNIY